MEMDKLFSKASEVSTGISVPLHTKLTTICLNVHALGLVSVAFECTALLFTSVSVPSIKLYVTTVPLFWVALQNNLVVKPI